MPQNARPTTLEGNSLASVMVEQTIIQAALTSIETLIPIRFSNYKNKNNTTE